MTDDIKKLALEFIREHPNSHLTTIEDSKPKIRVMHCARCDDDFSVWFATSGKSNKVRQINANPNVATLFFAETKVIRIFGSAQVIDDLAIKSDLWEDEWKKYWTEGVEDPDYVLIKVTPDEADLMDLTSEEMGTKKLV
jgi:general stress protein 26